MLFIQFAAKIDDGEAMSLALCVSRGYVLATDEFRATLLEWSHNGVTIAWHGQPKAAAHITIISDIINSIIGTIGQTLCET